MESCGDLYWFDELIMMHMRSDGKRELCLLNECPLTHQLTYYSGYYPLAWYIVTDTRVQDGYKNWLDNLTDRCFTS